MLGSGAEPVGGAAGMEEHAKGRRIQPGSDVLREATENEVANLAGPSQAHRQRGGGSGEEEDGRGKRRLLQPGHPAAGEVATGPAGRIARPEDQEVDAGGRNRGREAARRLIHSGDGGGENNGQKQVAHQAEGGDGGMC